MVLCDYVDISEPSFSFENVRTYIWGRGENAINSFVELSSKGAIIEGFIDSFIGEGENRLFAGRPLFLPDEIESMPNLTIYIAPVTREYRIQILERLSRFSSNPKVLMKGKEYGPATYDIQVMSQRIADEKNMIDYVRDGLYDKYSIDVFDSLLRYRLTNDEKLLKEVFEISHSIYFAPGIVKCNEKEIFVDAGGYDGRSSLSFSKYVKGKYSKIYILEPDEVMYQVCVENTKMWKMHDVDIIKKGAYSSQGTLNFHSSFLHGCSSICEEGESSIDTISIDEMLGEEEATYIKMDIEGAEMQALEGCKNTISHYHPKLALCIYHKEDDLWRIPYHLMTQYPEYHYYIRHYSDRTNETILYCV